MPTMTKKISVVWDISAISSDSPDFDTIMSIDNDIRAERRRLADLGKFDHIIDAAVDENSTLHADYYVLDQETVDYWVSFLNSKAELHPAIAYASLVVSDI